MSNDIECQNRSFVNQLFNELNVSILYSCGDGNFLTEIVEINYLFLYSFGFDNQYFYDYAHHRISEMIKKPLPKQVKEILNQTILDWQNNKIIDNKISIDGVKGDSKSLISMIRKLRDTPARIFKKEISKMDDIVLLQHIYENISFQIFIDDRCSNFLTNLRNIVFEGKIKTDLKTESKPKNLLESIKQINKLLLIKSNVVEFLRKEAISNDNNIEMKEIYVILFNIFSISKNKNLLLQQQNLIKYLNYFLSTDSFRSSTVDNKIIYANIFLCLTNDRDKTEIPILPLPNFLI